MELGETQRAQNKNATDLLADKFNYSLALVAPIERLQVTYDSSKYKLLVSLPSFGQNFSGMLRLPKLDASSLQVRVDV